LLHPRRVRSLGKLRHITCSSGRSLNRPFLLWCARSTLTGALLVEQESRHRQPASLPCPSFRLCVPRTPLKVTVLAPTLFSPVSHLPACDCSSEYPSACRELPFVVWPPHHRSHKTDPAINFARPSPISLATRTEPSHPRRPSLPRLLRWRRRARGERRPYLTGRDKTPWCASSPPNSNRMVQF
jgi:hypothetical protein